MATSDFLPFGTAAGANVTTLADYIANSGYTNGYQAGVAQSKFLNRTWRQSSFMSAAIGQLIADYGNGANAVDDGSIPNLEASLLAGLRGATPGRLIATRVFTSSGTYTPTAGTKSVMVELVGAGGAGGGVSATTSGQVAAGSGGGGAGYARSFLTTGFSGVAMSIPGASAGVVGGAGTTGGTTSFGSLLSATGGSGGSLGPATTASANTSINGGASGGVGSNGNIMVSQGGTGLYAVYAAFPVSGSGGLTYFGAGAGGLSGSNNGQSANTYGGGGGGACLTNAGGGSAGAGGNGGSGLILVWEYS